MTLPSKIPPLPPLPVMASPGGNQQQQTRVPYEAAKDCSQGFCSSYCPQWCYVIFPPPPPFSLADDDDSSAGGTAFSPFVIAIISILASAFLLVCYYTIISKYCSRRRCRRSGPLGPGDPVVDDDDDGGDQSQRHETWHASAAPNGLDEALISKISVYRYRRGEGLVDGTDCSVCLGEFREEESLRLLPKCSHAFHVQCIDTWLRSHSNCPLCRANIASLGPPPPPQQLPAPHLPSSSETSHVEAEGERNDETVVVVGDLEEETGLESDADGPKENLEAQGDDRHDVIEIRDDEGVQHFRRPFSTDSSQRGRVSIADLV